MDNVQGFLFEKHTGGVSVFIRDNPCKVPGCNGWCYEAIGECVVLENSGAMQCGIKCGKNAGGSEEEEDGPLDTHFGELGSGITSNNPIWNSPEGNSSFPPLIDPNQNSWSGFNIPSGDVIIFEEGDDGSFGFPSENFNSSDIFNEATGTENLDDPFTLYKIQLTNFIKHYTLSETWDEIDGELPEMCKSLKGPSFYNCARYNLVNHITSTYNLQLTDKEKWYLFNNFEEYAEISDFLKLNENSYGSASASIYVGLADAEALNLTYENAYGPAFANKLALIIDDKLEALGLDEHASMDPSTWYMLIKKEVNKIGGDIIDAYLKASERAFNEFWNEIIAPLRNTIEPTLVAIGDQFQSNAEEWQALMAVYGPMLLELGVDIGTDFIPGVGEVKAFTKAGLALSDGDYTTAITEFIGGVAGILPIGDLVAGAGKVVKAGAYIFTSFKAIKLLAKYGSNIYSTLIQYAQAGWKIAWDGGLKKMTFKIGGVPVGEIDGNGVPNLLSPIFHSIIDVAAIKNLNPKKLINGPNKNKISKEFIDEHGNRFNITDGPLADDLADIVANGDPTGTKTEYLMNEVFKDAGYTLHDGSYGPVDVFGRGMNGFDGVYIKGSLDNPTEIIINESKQFNANNANYVSLNKKTATNPAQMTDEWVDKVVAELRAEGKNDIADAIENGKDGGILAKIVTVVDATPAGNSNGFTGGVAIIRVE